MNPPLQIALKLEQRLANLHDGLSAKLGESHALTLEAIYAYGVACGLTIDLENLSASVDDE